MKLEIEPKLTIAPPPAFRISGTTCLAMSAGPITLTSRIFRHSSTLASIPLSTKTAALLTSTSIRPSDLAMCETAAATLFSSATSVRTKSALPPVRPISSATALPLRLVDFGDRDGGPLFGEAQAGGPADPRAAPRDDGDLPLEAFHETGRLLVSNGFV